MYDKTTFFGSGMQNGSADGYGPTEPIGSGIDDIGKTEPVMPQGGAGIDPTLPPGYNGMGESIQQGMDVLHRQQGQSPFPKQSMGQPGWGGFYQETKPPEDYDEVTKPIVMNGIEGFAPVVGWLVCIDGQAKGMDYRIRPGMNYIGRGEDMDICIKGDQQIGRDRQAKIGYDPEERLFMFAPAEGVNIVRINGKMIMESVQLKEYDVIKIGSTQLMFIPLCGERFNWDV